jgi:hypothetical protein
MQRIHRSKGVVLTLAVVGLALAGCADSSSKHEFVHPSHVEHVEGSDLAHVTLTARAAERTGIEVAKVADTPVTRKETLQGEVVARSGGSGLAIKVASNGHKPSNSTAKVWPLVRGDASWTARQVEAPPTGSSELRFAVDDAEGLVPGQRVGVELALSTTHRKVVPYSSVIYDEHGNTWVYTSPERLNYVRAPITIDFIEGDVAVLKDGPPTGTTVVSVGAIELYGTEFEVGH